jgi:hypothetical protein
MEILSEMSTQDGYSFWSLGSWRNSMVQYEKEEYKRVQGRYDLVRYLPVRYFPAFYVPVRFIPEVWGPYAGLG